MKRIKTGISIIIMLAAFLSVFALNVAASPDSIQPIDTSKKVTLTLQYLYNEQPIDGAEFRLYRVGDVTRAGAFKVNSPFYEVYDPNDEWKDVVSKMLQQVKVREVDPVRVKNTDSNGVAVFQSEENSPLKTGLYLVESIPLELENEDAYIATSFLVMLPSFVGSNHDGVQQVWNYDVIAAPKARYSGNTTKKDPILPQTGVLWWPVPVLAIAGFCIFLLGIFIGRKKKRISKKKYSSSGAMLIMGILCVSTALCLVLYNGWDNMRAGSDASDVCASIMRIMPDPYKEVDGKSQGDKNSPVDITEMPVKRVQDNDFSAILSIPSLSLELPVRDKWSYPGLRRSPCRYTGSAYTDNLVICGHNYSAHFGNLKRLTKGSDIVLTAMNGDVFSYKVEEVTELSPTDISEMTDSEYDLTLFTCTIGGGKRVTVRCRLINLVPHDPRTVSSEYVLF